MSDPKDETAGELSELEPLPELEELEPLAEPEPVEELAPVEEPEPVAELEPVAEEPREASLEAEPEQPRSRKEIKAAEDAAAAAAAAAAVNSAPSQAPLMLKKAAMLTAAGCLLPFLVMSDRLGVQIGSKLIVLFAAYLFHVCVLALSGEKVDPTFAKLAKPFVDLSQRPKSFGALIAHKVPSALHVIAWVVMLSGILLPVVFIGAFSQEAAEVGLLMWAAATFVHIDGYERGHRFNPIFPLLFSSHAVVGLMTVLLQLRAENKNLILLLGALVVTAGGFFAIYTMFVAMKQAKIEGDLKKQAAAEARKAARAARRKQ